MSGGLHSPGGRGVPGPVRDLVLFCTVALILLTLPYVGRLRSVLGDEGVRLPLIILFAVAGAGFILFHIRLLRNRPGRWIGLGLFLAVFAAVFVLLRGPNPVVGLVEKVHLLQYSMLAVLFWWAANRRFPGYQVYVLALLFTVLAGLLDEYVQHLLPIRVGEVRDVWINFVAGTLGLLYVALVLRPRAGAAVPHAVAWRNILVGAAVFLLALGGFIHQVHLGHRIEDPDFGFSFNSRFSREELRERDLAHGREWQRRGERFNPEETVAGYPAWALEDFYITEALRHIGARNHHLDAERDVMAAMEQRILIRYFPAVLKALDPRLSREVRAQLRAWGGANPQHGLGSTEMTYLYTGITARGLWALVVSLVAACLGGALVLHRRG